MKMQKQLAKTESEQAKERLETFEGIMSQLEDLADQPLSWYEMSQIGLAHDHFLRLRRNSLSIIIWNPQKYHKEKRNE